MPSKSANVKNKGQYDALKDKGMSKQRRQVANSPKASKHGGEKSHSGSGKSNQGGITASTRQQAEKAAKPPPRSPDPKPPTEGDTVTTAREIMTPTRRSSRRTPPPRMRRG